MVKKTKENNTLVGQFLTQHLGEVKMLSEVSSEITYQIPTALSVKFKDFFSSFDNSLDSLDIRSYGISVTTLEEVFLRVGHGDDSNDNQKMKDSIKEELKQDETMVNEYSIADSAETGTCNIFMDHLGALIKKRL
jgi:ATP-binding cassette subfamily A (ABC1) protein 3